MSFSGKSVVCSSKIELTTILFAWLECAAVSLLTVIVVGRYIAVKLAICSPTHPCSNLFQLCPWSSVRSDFCVLQKVRPPLCNRCLEWTKLPSCGFPTWIGSRHILSDYIDPVGKLLRDMRCPLPRFSDLVCPPQHCLRYCTLGSWCKLYCRVAFFTSTCDPFGVSWKYRSTSSYTGFISQMLICSH